jgi:hypothetical protein
VKVPFALPLDQKPLGGSLHSGGLLRRWVNIRPALTAFAPFSFPRL